MNPTTKIDCYKVCGGVGNMRCRFNHITKKEFILGRKHSCPYEWKVTLNIEDK